MNTILNSLDTTFWQQVFWTLLHSIWQAALIATLLLACLSLLPAKRCRLRYALSYGALILVVLTSAVTHGIISNSTTSDNSIDTVGLVSSSGHASNDVSHTDHPESHLHIANNEASESPVGWIGLIKKTAKQWQPVLMASWLTIAALLLMRNLISVVQAGKLRAATTHVSPEIQRLFENVKTKLDCPNSSQLRMSNSASLLSPYVIGVLRATIVIPATMLTQLSNDEIESVLAHEIAHIKRHDFLFNLLQLAIGSLYFFNPAVYFINRQIGSEREACCDETAVKATSSDVAYAQILAKFGQWNLSRKIDGQPTVAMGFTGPQNGKLLDRVSRLLMPEKSPNTISSAWGFIAVLLATFFVLASTSSGTRAIASYTATLIQESEVRAAEINESKKEYSAPGHMPGKSKIVMQVVNDEGVVVDDGDVFINSKSGPQRRKSWGIATSLKKMQLEQEFEFEAGNVSLLIDVDGFAPVLALHDEEVYANTTIFRDIKLNVGESCKLKVIDTEGNPIEGASIRRQVKTSLMSAWTPGTEFSTNGKGEAIVANLNHDLHDFALVWKNGYVSAKVKGLDREGVINVTLEKTPTTRGMVVDHLGNPVPNAKIYTFDEIEFRSEHSRPFATTDTKGKFETVQLSPGKHNLMFEAGAQRGIATAVPCGSETKLQMLEPRSIKVRFKGDPNLLDPEKMTVRQYHAAPEPTNDLQSSHLYFEVPFEFLEEESAFVINGVVPWSLSIRYSGLERSIQFFEGDVDNLEEVVIDLAQLDIKTRQAKIAFEFEGRKVYPQGSVRLFRQQNPGGSWVESELVEIKDGEAEVMVSSDKLQVKSEGMTGFVVIGDFGNQREAEIKDDQFVVKVEPAGAIEGIVCDANGKPISTKLWVKYTFLDESRSSFFQDEIKVNSKANGKFLLTPIPLETKVEIHAGEPLINYFKEVQVTAENPVVETSLTVPESGPVNIKVTDVDGKPMVRTQIKIQLKKIGFSYGGNTDSDGNWSCNGLKIGEKGYQLAVLPRSGFQIPKVQPVQAGDSINIVLEKGYSLSGKVVDENNQPVDEFEVKAIFEDRFIVADSLTNAKGEFIFTRLPAETVKLQAAHQWEQIKSPISESYTPGKDDEVVLKVKPVAQGR